MWQVWQISQASGIRTCATLQSGLGCLQDFLWIRALDLIQIKELAGCLGHNSWQMARYQKKDLTTMTLKPMRKIVQIDEGKCNGCGLCIPNCAEGALRIINGKARLVADKLCDGLGACLGTCPMGAITIEERPADEFDEQAVHQHLHSSPAVPVQEPLAAFPHGSILSQGGAAGGCPGSRMRMLRSRSSPASESSAAGERPSRLAQWPVQLALVPPTGAMWEDADVLIAADCVPFAYPDFHEKLLAGRSLAITCPKLDDVRPYIQKLAMIFAGNSIRSITVAHMEVPCCTGIVRVVQMALVQAGREDIPLHDIMIGIDGQVRDIA